MNRLYVHGIKHGLFVLSVSVLFYVTLSHYLSITLSILGVKEGERDFIQGLQHLSLLCNSLSLYLYYSLHQVEVRMEDVGSSGSLSFK